MRSSLMLALMACGGSSSPPEGFADAGPIMCDLARIPGTAGEITAESFSIDWVAEGGVSRGRAVTFRVTDDVESMLVVVEHGSEWTAFDRVAQDHRLLIELDADEYGEMPPFFHSIWPVVAAAFPSDEDSALLPGCLEIRPYLDGNFGTEQGTLHVITRRRPAGGTMRLSLVRSGDTDLMGTTLDELGMEIAAVFRDSGVGEVDIELIDLVDTSPFVPSEGPLLDELRAAYVPDDPFRVIIYVVQAFSDDPFTLGFAAGIPGPTGIAGTAASGVIVAIDGHLDGEGVLELSVLAETAAHEVGHQLGLLHTSESDGDFHDPLSDTDECTPRDDVDDDGEVSAEECPDGSNLMFWVTGDLPQRELSPWQQRLLHLAPVTQ